MSLQLFCRFPKRTIGLHFVILAETGDELSRIQEHFGSRLSVKVSNDLECQGKSRPFSKAALLVPCHDAELVQIW